MLEPMTDDCICRWTQAMVGVNVSASGCAYVRDVPNYACPAHFGECPHCDGSGRKPLDQHTQVLIDRQKGIPGAA